MVLTITAQYFDIILMAHLVYDRAKQFILIVEQISVDPHIMRGRECPLDTRAPSEDESAVPGFVSMLYPESRLG